MKKPLRLHLTTLLSLAFFLVSCIVFSSVALLSDRHMQQMIHLQQDQALAARIERIEGFLQDTQSFELLVKHPKLYENMFGQEDNLLILTNSKRVLIQINPLQISLPSLNFSSTLQFKNNQVNTPSTRLAFKQFDFQGQSHQLIAGKQLAEGQIVLSNYRKKLILYSLFGILCSTLMAWAAGRYILNSMQKLIDATAQIGLAHMHRRFDIQSSSLEVHELTQAMNKMLNRIETAYQQLARFSEDISHELRTPLNNLMGQTQILLSHPRAAHELEHVLYSNLEEYERLNQMIESMLFIARVEHGNYVTEKHYFNLKELLDRLVEYFDFLAEEKNIKFDLKIESHVELFAHQILVERALANLMSNAITYGKENSNIQIQVESRLQHYVIEVCTPNVWIEEQHLPHLFERFYQIDDSRHLKAQTGGLGLAIVESIMQLHHGYAEVKNTTLGVVFRLYFPQESRKN